MTKVAVCISGQPRRGLYTYSYIYENIIKPNNADVFIHMHYDEKNLYMEKHHADNGNCYLELGIDKELIRLYNPKSYLIEAPRNFQKPNIKLPDKRIEDIKKMNKHKSWTDEQHILYTVKQFTSQIYSIYKANELKELYANENGFVYDYVIRIRFDILPLEPIICSNYNPNFIYYLEIGQPDDLISCWINFGSNTIINIFSSLYLHIDYINTFKYFKKEERQPNLEEPSNICSGFSEHMFRDLLHLFKLPKMSIKLNCYLA